MLDATFAALSDPTRRAILARLATGECSVTKLAAPFRVSLPAISKHLRVLEQGGLIARRKEGRIHYCRLMAEPLREAGGWISQYSTFWEQQLDALAEYLKREELPWQVPQSSPSSPSPSSAGSQAPAKRSSKRGRTRRR
jgi:DNA-binding transcriptional ArsR family regulator